MQYCLGKFHINLLSLEIYQIFSLICRLNRCRKSYAFSRPAFQTGSCNNFHIRPKFVFHKFLFSSFLALICKCSESTWFVLLSVWSHRNYSVIVRKLRKGCLFNKSFYQSFMLVSSNNLKEYNRKMHFQCLYFNLHEGYVLYHQRMLEYHYGVYLLI